ncbi:hypothetical protein NHX12_009062 [Muraenolepis orangiensis]|uniref:G-protein coupled receptors family 3 profile domain-containing protein n=1 Tax=Muraenolepis orangiensis TaxID=630683 RepID=A0A9Q0IAF5_9TELE|nr:hypothetical protein NHX12_009062 [Muraenolepis orangiensis]
MAHTAPKIFFLSGIFILNNLDVGSAALSTDCAFIGEEESNSFYEDGDVVLGGLFPLHYTRVSSPPTYTSKPEPGTYKYFSARALRWMQTMTFAIREINQRTDLLPALKLGFHIRDSCDDIPVSLKRSLLLVNGQPGQGAIGNRSLEADGGLMRKRLGSMARGLGCADVTRSLSPVIIGDASSGVSMALLRSLGPFHIPLVSYFASCSCLSEKQVFPMFMRTMPSDTFQVRALSRLVSHFGWTWVGVIGVESDYARFAIQLFLQESSLYGVCAAYVHLYPTVLSPQPLDELLDIIQGSSSKVIVNFSSESEVHSIMRGMRQRNITGIQWIASEAWATAKSLWEEFGDLLGGTLGFGIHKAEVIPGLKQYLSGLRLSHIHDSAFLTELWEETLNCRLNGSVNTHSHAVNHLDRKPCSGMEDLNHVYSTFSDVSQLRVSYNVYKAVYLVAHALQRMSDCEAGQGPFVNGTCGNPKSVEPWQLFHYMTSTAFSVLGEKVDFDLNGDPIALYDLMNWKREQDGSLRLVRVGFYDASLSPELSLVVNESAIQWPVGQQAVWSQCSESCPPGKRVARRKGEPVCCFDCVTCAEGEFSNSTDSLDCTRCPDGMATLPGSSVMKWFGPTQQRASVLLCTVVQGLICLTWLLTYPPFSNSNTGYSRTTIIIECATGSEVGFWSVLGYIGLLACLCFVVAFLARELPDNFNEAKFITFSMLIFFAVWITFIPVYVSTAGKYTVAVHIFAILASAYGLLFCIFAPKCYIIILQPEKNSKKNMMRK